MFTKKDNNYYCKWKIDVIKSGIKLAERGGNSI